MNQNDRDALAAAMLLKAYCTSKKNCYSCVLHNSCFSKYCDILPPEELDLKKIKRKVNVPGL